MKRESDMREIFQNNLFGENFRTTTSFSRAV